MPEWLGALGGILLVDLTLSGDNALVVGAAAAGLPSAQRRIAILLGGGGAIVFRVVFAILATLLLRLPLVEALGGLLLVVIAVRLLLGREEHTPKSESAEQAASTSATTEPSHAHPAPSTAMTGLFGALVTIIIADVTMSLDNILAVGALAAGNLPLLAVGLLLSVAFLMVASTLVAALIQRLPILLDAAALVLGWTAGTMILHDARVAPLFGGIPQGFSFVVPLATVLLVLAADILLRILDARGKRANNQKEVETERVAS